MNAQTIAKLTASQQKALTAYAKAHMDTDMLHGYTSIDGFRFRPSNHYTENGKPVTNGTLNALIKKGMMTINGWYKNVYGENGVNLTAKGVAWAASNVNGFVS